MSSFPSEDKPHKTHNDINNNNNNSNNNNQQQLQHTTSSEGWKERIYIPTIIAGIFGGGAGLLSKHRKTHGIAKISATYAANLAIVTGCYCGARELAREVRASEPGDLINSVVGGTVSGALLGKLQGGHIGAVRYGLIFACVGTAVDFAASRLKSLSTCTGDPTLMDNSQDQEKREKSKWWSWPEWAPIQVLDEEAAAAKRDQEQQFYARRGITSNNKLNKEDIS